MGYLPLSYDHGSTFKDQYSTKMPFWKNTDMCPFRSMHSHICCLDYIKVDHHVGTLAFVCYLSIINIVRSGAYSGGK
jgi:hypothetical protein